MIKKTSDGTTKHESMSKKELTEELHKLIFRKFKKRQVHLIFIDNIWCTDLAHMQLRGKFNKGICFYYVLLIFSVNTHGLFLLKIQLQLLLQLLMLFKKS